MRVISTSLAATALLFTSTALSTTIPPFCMTDYDASIVANNYAQLLSNFSVPLATAVLSNDFTDQSDSANTLIDSGTQSPFPVGLLVCQRCSLESVLTSASWALSPSRAKLSSSICNALKPTSLSRSLTHGIPAIMS